MSMEGGGGYFALVPRGRFVRGSNRPWGFAPNPTFATWQAVGEKTPNHHHKAYLIGV